MHNDIKPGNLFRRGAKIFIGGKSCKKNVKIIPILNNITIHFISKSDFDSASFDDKQHRGFTARFASSNFFAKKPRHQIDDLESLVFSIWYIAGVLGGPKPVPEGFVLSKCKKNGTAEAKMRVIIDYNFEITKYTK